MPRRVLIEFRRKVLDLMEVGRPLVEIQVQHLGRSGFDRGVDQGSLLRGDPDAVLAPVVCPGEPLPTRRPDRTGRSLSEVLVALEPPQAEEAPQRR